MVEELPFLEADETDDEATAEISPEVDNRRLDKKNASNRSYISKPHADVQDSSWMYPPENWDQIARGIDLKSKTSRLVVDFFAKKMNLKLEVDTVKRSCANGSRRSISYYRVQGSVYGGKFPNLSPEYARVGANDKKSMNELCHAFSEKRWNRLGTAR